MLKRKPRYMCVRQMPSMLELLFGQVLIAALYETYTGVCVFLEIWGLTA